MKTAARVATACAAVALATAQAARAAAASTSWRDAVGDREDPGRACLKAATSWRDAGISSAGDAGERGGGLIRASRWVSCPLPMHPHDTVTPWLKRLDPATGRCERVALVPGEDVVLERARRRSNPCGLRQLTGSIVVSFVDGAWRSDAFTDPTIAGARESLVALLRRSPHLAHGATFDAGTRAYVFIEHAEVRDPELERAAAGSTDAAMAWANWLEERGDPYAAPLRGMLAGETFGARASWWLEGINCGMRGVQGRFEMRDGFLRSAHLAGGGLPIDLHLMHLLTLRVASALEELSLDPIWYCAAAHLPALARSSIWPALPFPSTLRKIHWSGCRASATVLQEALPHLVVEHPW
jgi:hypothetical protein